MLPASSCPFLGICFLGEVDKWDQRCYIHSYQPARAQGGSAQPKAEGRAGGAGVSDCSAMGEARNPPLKRNPGLFLPSLSTPSSDKVALCLQVAPGRN